jgi:hypothetical protein
MVSNLFYDEGLIKIQCLPLYARLRDLSAAAEFAQHVHLNGALATKNSNSFATASCNQVKARVPNRWAKWQ